MYNIKNTIQKLVKSETDYSIKIYESDDNTFLSIDLILSWYTFSFTVSGNNKDKAIKYFSKHFKEVNNNEYNSSR